MKTPRFIQHSLLNFAVLGLVGTGMASTFTSAAFAQSQPVSVSTAAEVKTLASGKFIRKSKKLSGGYEVIQQGGQTIIRFADDFRTVNGPDLKVFLSPNAIENASGKNATQGSVLLGFVKSKSGTQDYIVPEGVNLSEFSSVLVHCEAFSVLWGGGNI